DAFTAIETVRIPGRGGLGDPEVHLQALRVDGAEVTALRRTDEGRLELRVVNPTDESSTLTVSDRTGELVDLRGTPTGEGFDGAVSLGPWKIATIALDD
ncbi:MAG: hypothetical protein H0U29_11630, partial [Acidimicrobiia bacterium]|nr:hypothetical protein [Acidimicrobiia bacterium]